MSWKSVEVELPEAGAYVVVLTHDKDAGPLIQMATYDPLAWGSRSEVGWIDRAWSWSNARGECVAPVTHWKEPDPPEEYEDFINVYLIRRLLVPEALASWCDQVCEAIAGQVAEARGFPDGYHLTEEGRWLVRQVDSVKELFEGEQVFPQVQVILDAYNDDDPPITCKVCGAIASVIAGHQPWREGKLKLFRSLCDVHRNDGQAAYRYKLEVRRL